MDVLNFSTLEVSMATEELMEVTLHQKQEIENQVIEKEKGF